MSDYFVCPNCGAEVSLKALSCPECGSDEKTGTSDPQYIVIDEVAGQGLALLFVPLDLYLYLVGFLLFRFFDILKPWPLHAVETRLRGGLGVMADDLAAGAYTALLLYIFYILKQMVIDVFKGIA